MFKHQHCGGKHNTVSEARNCESRPAGTRSLVSASANYSASLDRLRAQRPHPSIARAAQGPAWHEDTATERQVSYLRDLIAKRCAERAPIDVVEIAMNVMDGKKISFSEARKAIEAIKAQPYRQEKQGGSEYAAPATTTPATPQASNLKGKINDLKAQVPDGRYAVRGTVEDAEDSKLRFFWVRVSKRGFLNIDQYSSDARNRVPYGPRYLRILKAIIEAGTEEAGKAFAINLGRCRKCYKALTDEDNPYKPFGFGPECGPKVMGCM